MLILIPTTRPPVFTSGCTSFAGRLDHSQSVRHFDMSEKKFEGALDAHVESTKSQELGERKLSLLPDNMSIEEAQIIEQNENRNGQFHRSFTPRQVHVS
jgi:hypothetical protein